MTETVIPVHLSTALLADVQQEAGRAGVSVERWLLNLAADRIRDKAVTERFFTRTPQESDGQAFLDILSATRNHPPAANDHIEHAWPDSTGGPPVPPHRMGWVDEASSATPLDTPCTIKS